MNQSLYDVKASLVFAHHLLAIMGWDDLTYTHLSARHPHEERYFIMPFGYLFAEVTVDNLLEVTFDGQVLNAPDQTYNPTGQVIHSSVYRARPDVHSVFHIHTTANIAVASIQDGLMPLSQWALLFYERWRFHPYDSLSCCPKTQGQKITSDLADATVLLMSNHGSLVVGGSVAEAFYYQYHFEMACRTQCQLLAMNQPLRIPDEACCRKAAKDLFDFEKHNGLRDWTALRRKYHHLWPQNTTEELS